MTQKELFLSLKSYEDFDKNRSVFRGMPVDDEIRTHSEKIFLKHMPQRICIMKYLEVRKMHGFLKCRNEKEYLIC